MKLYRGDTVTRIHLERGKSATLRKERLTGTITYNHVHVMQVIADSRSKMPANHLGVFSESALTTIADPLAVHMAVLYHRPWYNHLRALFNL
jgi:hypothetical protein